MILYERQIALQKRWLRALVIDPMMPELLEVGVGAAGVEAGVDGDGDEDVAAVLDVVDVVEDASNTRRQWSEYTDRLFASSLQMFVAMLLVLEDCSTS